MKGTQKTQLLKRIRSKGGTMCRNDILSFLPKQKKNEKTFSDNKKIAHCR
jgi:hypothetical protein